MKFIQPYNDLLTKIVNRGVKTDCTLALYNEQITFNLESLNQKKHSLYRYLLVMPEKRGSRKSFIKYALAEAVWYRQATRSVEMIKEFGPIWETMADANGNANSNYGYQLYENQRLCQDIKQLPKAKEQSFMIASHSNMTSSNDLVCNNRIDIRLSEENGEWVLDSRVIARSIDMIMGLPYDMFAAQGFLAKIASMLQIQHRRAVRLRELTFNIANVHWYDVHTPSQEELDALSTNILVIPFEHTPFHRFDELRLANADKVREYRDEEAQFSYVTDSFDVANIHSQWSKMQQYAFATLDEAVEAVEEKIYALDNRMSRTNQKRFTHLQTIKERLLANEWERKTLIVVEHSLIYIMYNGREYIMMEALHQSSIVYDLSSMQTQQ